jgi:hypothetical protein
MAWEQVKKIISKPDRGPKATAMLDKRNEGSHAKLLVFINASLVDELGMRDMRFNLFFGSGDNAGHILLMPNDGGVVAGTHRVRKARVTYRLGHFPSLPDVHTETCPCDIEIVDLPNLGGRGFDITLPAFGGERAVQQQRVKDDEPPAEPAKRHEETEDEEEVVETPRAFKPPRPEARPEPPEPEVARPVPPAPPPLQRQAAPTRNGAECVSPAPLFTGPTGITVDVARNALTYEGRKADLADRAIRLTAALAVLKYGDILPYEFVAKKIWKHVPQQYTSYITGMLPPTNITLQRLGLEIRVIRGVGLALSKR